MKSDTTHTSDTLQTWKAEFFKALGHPARIRILECLREGEKSAGDIMEELGLEQSNGSQHLAVLRNREFVIARREGTTILYSVRDPLIYQVLDLLRQYFHEHLTGLRNLLDEMQPNVAKAASSG
jgi:DNA-binding transcriptional ArsR family regulator